MSIPKIEEIRSRLTGRVAEVRSRVQARGFAGQQMQLGRGRLVEQARTRIQARGFAGQQMRFGGGALVEQARRRADVATRRLTERKPGVIPMVKEFRPGERVRQLFGEREITDLSVERDMSIAGERPAYPYDGREMSIFV